MGKTAVEVIPAPKPETTNAIAEKCRRILTRWLNQVEAMQEGLEPEGVILKTSYISLVSDIYTSASREKLAQAISPLRRYSTEQLERMRREALANTFAVPPKALGNGNGNGNGKSNGKH